MYAVPDKAVIILNKKVRLKELVIALAIPLAAGGLSAFITKDAMKSFQTLRQPPLSPPAWLFPVVWTLLYLLMGLASYLVLTSGASEPRREKALTAYALQLAANFCWSVIFFSLRLYLTAFIWLLVLWVFILISTVMFFYIRKSAGRLLIPYLAWVTFAGYLNLGVYLLN